MSLSLREKIVDIVNEQLRIKIDITKTEEDLNLYGLDSISFVQIIVDLEQFFDCEIPDSMLAREQMNTISKIESTLRKILYD